jgi:hypothetical protein
VIIEKIGLIRIFLIKINNMAFKLRSSAPIRKIDMEDGVLGKANRDGTIDINKDIKDPQQEKEVIEHEKLHLDQMERGDLDYDDKNVYWKGKTYPRSKMEEGAKNLPWEKEVYDETKETKNMNKNFKLKGPRGQSESMSALSNRGLIKKNSDKIKTKRVVIFTDDSNPGLRGANVTKSNLTDYAVKNTVKRKVGTGYDTGKTKHIIKVPKSEYKKENPMFKDKKAAEGYFIPTTPRDAKRLTKYNRRVGARFISEEKAANKVDKIMDKAAKK